jgi:hypothetical protein
MRFKSFLKAAARRSVLMPSVLGALAAGMKLIEKVAPVSNHDASPHQARSQDCDGKPIIAGIRIAVEHILRNYPHLTAWDIRAA